MPHVSYPLVHHTTLTKLWGNRGWQNSSSLQDPFDLLILTICQHHSLMQWLSLCVDCPNCVKTRPQLNTEVDNKFFDREASFLTHCTTLHMDHTILNFRYFGTRNCIFGHTKAIWPFIPSHAHMSTSIDTLVEHRSSKSYFFL